jgi:hypothetical protein
VDKLGLLVMADLLQTASEPMKWHRPNQYERLGNMILTILLFFFRGLFSTNVGVIHNVAAEGEKENRVRLKLKIGWL